MAIITTNDLKKGICIMFHDSPYLVIEKTFVSPGKGSAFSRVKLKNLKNNSVTEFTFKSGEKIEEAPVEVKEFQYLFKDVSQLTFMDPRTYEQFNLPKEMASDFLMLMKEGETYQIYVLDNQLVTIRPPLKIRLVVTHAEAGAKGNTVTGATKEVEVETGYKLQVPLFIKEGDTITINVETKEYGERV